VKFPRFTTRAFAVICVAVIAGYVMWMGFQLNETLSGPGWCRTALGAEQASGKDGVIKGLDACVGLLTIQLKSLATNSHILLGTVAMCLIVLIVIVVAGARLDFKASKAGVEGTVEREPAPVRVVNEPDQPVPVEPAP
jgi:hypothetical protein